MIGRQRGTRLRARNGGILMTREVDLMADGHEAYMGCGNCRTGWMVVPVLGVHQDISRHVSHSSP